MDITETERGLAIAEFRDERGTLCTIQESSLATEAAIWFGPSHVKEGSHARMHLTQEMARQIAIGMRAHVRGETEGMGAFLDRYGSSCSHGFQGGTFNCDMHMNFDGNEAWSMQLSRENAAALLPLMTAFVSSGSIGGAVDENALETPTKVEMDVKIPASMLARTDIGETGVSAQDLIDALCDVIAGQDEHSLTQAIGHDRAKAIIGIQLDVRKLWRDTKEALPSG